MFFKNCNYLSFLLFLFTLPIFSGESQNVTFDELAAHINIISYYKKTETAKLLKDLNLKADMSSNSSTLVARCLYEEALFNERQRIIDTLLTERIKTSLDKKNIPLMEKALLQSALGINLLSTGDYAEAFAIQLNALDNFKKLSNNEFIAKTLNFLGIICKSIHLLNLSEYYFLEAILYLTPDHYDYNIFKSNKLITQLYNYKEDAMASMLELIEIAEKEKRVELMLRLYNNIGAYLLEKQPETALIYLKKIENLQFENIRLSSLLNGNLGYYYFLKEDYSKSLSYFKNIQKITEENSDFEYLTLVYYYLSEIFENQNRLDSALHYARKFDDIKEQLRSNMVAIETHQKYITAYLDAKKNELIIAEQKIELKNRQVFIIVIVSASMLLLAIMFLLFINQQKRRKTSENRELNAKLELEKNKQKFEKEKFDAKVREISSYSVLVSHKNSILQQISTLNTKIWEDNKNYDEITKKIDKIIKSNLNIDEEWVNFKLHFDSVHPMFFEKLKQQCADLTDENLKICAYIKMGMTTKQIAQLLHVRTDSISKSKYRIKKKLGLADNESLATYIGNM